MSQDDFQSRLQRIGTTTSATPTGRLQKANPAKKGWSGAIFGGIASAVVVMLFANIQAISDAAPEAIRNSSAPGALGAPIALLSIAWFSIIPILFTRHILRSARAMQGFELPGSFLTGAFVVLAIGLIMLKFGGL